MNWTLPGTMLTADSPQAAEALFSSLFAAGGLVLSQVCQITGLEPHTVQNWIKRGFLTPPEKKKYNRRQLGRIAIIHMLKAALPMESICRLLSYVNGSLADESDDIIDDGLLYLIFLRLAGTNPYPDFAAALDAAMADYRAPTPGARERVAAALEIMLIAWHSSRLKQQAEEKMQALGLQPDTQKGKNR